MQLFASVCKRKSACGLRPLGITLSVQTLDGPRTCIRVSAMFGAMIDLRRLRSPFHLAEKDSDGQPAGRGDMCPDAAGSHAEGPTRREVGRSKRVSGPPDRERGCAFQVRRAWPRRCVSGSAGLRVVQAKVRFRSGTTRKPQVDTLCRPKLKPKT